MDEFLSREAAVQLVAVEHDLSIGAAEAAVGEAINSKKVRLIGRVGNLQPGPVSVDGLKNLFGFLLIGDLKLNADDLRWQLSKQLGERSEEPASPPVSPSGAPAPPVARVRAAARSRPGPKPDTLRRYAGRDRELFPEIAAMMASGLSRSAACQQLAEDGRVAGAGQSASRAAQLAKLYAAEHQRNSL